MFNKQILVTAGLLLLTLTLNTSVDATENYPVSPNLSQTTFTNDAFPHHINSYLSIENDTWSMAGANPQRTSWIPEGVNPAEFAQFGVEWFLPIEAYIGQHVQLIAGRNKIYVSTARGLYALDAASGNVAWRFDTELPLGHSPTIVGAVVYVGSLDKRVYALNADTGALIWTFAGADGGFSTNPLVVTGKVLLGSRDGFFYALDQNSGNLLWQYPQKNQEPLAPILYSAAYANDKVFFAANDNFAYALNVNNGTLAWKSAKMPGDGFQAWWPVVYNGYVIFSSAVPYAETSNPGTHSIVDVINPGDPYYNQMHGFQFSTDVIKTIQRDDVFHQDEVNGAILGASFQAGSANDTTGISWSWPNGKTVVNASKVTEYLENDGQTLINRPTSKPWRRSVIILDINNGTEYTFDSDSDSKPEYAPFLYTGTKSGNRYPPLVIPTTNASGTVNDVLYIQNLYQYYGGWGIPGARLNAWQFGTQYVQPVGDQFAIDEPFAISAGGPILYQNLCCDRIGKSLNLLTGSQTQFWGYSGYTLESIKLPWNQIESWMRSVTPGYDVMWFGSSMYDYYPRLYGSYGTMNGIYHNHGLQNPIIPYNGRLYVHRSNAIIALGPNPVAIRKMTQNETPAQYEQNIRQEYPNFSRPLLEINPPDQNLEPVLTVDDIKINLDYEINKMLQTGHLRPGYFNSNRELIQFANYFENPADTLYTLVQAYPHVSDSLKPDLERYIKQHYHMYFEGDWLYARTGYWIENPQPYNLNNINGVGQLQPREWMSAPPEVALDMTTHQKSPWVGVNWAWEFPQHNFYAMWKYAETFYSDNPSNLFSIYNMAKGRLDTTPPHLGTLVDAPWVHNGYITGYIGFLKLQELAGQTGSDAALRTSVTIQLNNLLSIRANDFRKDHPWTGPEDYFNGNVNKRSMNIARNFMYMSPELGQHLHDNTLPTVTEAIDEYNWIAPYWMASRYEAAFAEFASSNLYTNHAMFQANAYILEESVDQLLKYIDAPAFKTGDLFYIQQLATVLEQVGYQLHIHPGIQTVETGGTAEFNIEIGPVGDYSDPVTLNFSTSSPNITVHLSATEIHPPGEAVLTITDLHTPGSLTSGLWHEVTINANSNNIERSGLVRLLVNGYQSFLPIVRK